MFSGILELMASFNISLSHKYTMLESTHNEMIILERKTGKKYKVVITEEENEKED